MTPPPAEELVPRLFLGPALRTQPDRRLVRLVRDGYEAAFEEIVRRYGGSLRRYAGAIVGGRAEDVTQDAFSKALLALRRDDNEIELRPWLYRIVRNTALNDLRDRPPGTVALAEAIEGHRGVAEEVERREEVAELTSRLRALPEPQRAAIVMRELEGLGHEEIASALGISGGAARQAIHRARTTLRNGLGMAIPLPLLRAMLEGGAAQPVEIAAGGTGAGMVLKAATATVLVAGTFGAGVALHESHAGHPGKATAGANASGAHGPSKASGPLSTATASTKAGKSPHGAPAAGGAGEPHRSQGSDQGGSGSRDAASHGASPHSDPGPGDGRHHSGPSSSEPSGNRGDGSSGDGGLSGSSGGSPSGDAPEPGGGGSGSGGSSGGSGEGSGSGGGGSGSGDLSTPDGSSGSNSGPGSGGDISGGGETLESSSGESRDLRDGDGFSGQTQLQPQEDR